MRLRRRRSPLSVRRSTLGWSPRTSTSPLCALDAIAAAYASTASGRWMRRPGLECGDDGEVVVQTAWACGVAGKRGEYGGFERLLQLGNFRRRTRQLELHVSALESDRV